MRTCQEAGCNNAAVKRWEGRHVCYECYDVLRDDQQMMPFQSHY